MKNEKEKLIAHTCCAVCLCYPSEILKEYDTTYYFYNPNIYPKDEYERRKLELKKYAEKKELKFVVDESDNDIINWNKSILGFENEKEGETRCERCFYNRLKKTFEYASKNNIKLVTTVMTVSPHKKSSVIESILKDLSLEFNIDYLFIDFKKNDGFKKTNLIANSEGLYRQNYCGCEYSVRN